MSKSRNVFLDNGASEESDAGSAYDSEAAEISKGARASTSSGRGAKRRKLSHSEEEEDDDIELAHAPEPRALDSRSNQYGDQSEAQDEESEDERISGKAGAAAVPKYSQSDSTSLDNKGPSIGKVTAKANKKSKEKDSKPGVIYLSSLPPYLKPSALRNLLTHQGFSPISRLFLTPASKSKAGSKKTSRQLYTEGWIEFANKKTARRCAEALNAQIIGGKKGGFYHDDLWNMKYLKGMSWDELMSGIREEKREEEGRRDDERRQIAKETKRFIEGVEEGRKVEGIKRKRSEKARKGGGTSGVASGTNEDVKRTWRQFEVKGKGKGGMGPQRHQDIDDDAKEVLGKIF